MIEYNNLNKIIEKGIVQIEYLPTLIASKKLACIISTLANTSGGLIVLGANKKITGEIEFNGIGNDYRLNEVISGAFNLLEPIRKYKNVMMNFPKLN